MIEDRTHLDLEGVLADKVANNANELQNIIFAKDLGLITDLEVGSDGYVYILADHDRDGTIFKINRADNSTNPNI